MLRDIENQNYQSLAEVEISSSYRGDVSNNEDVTRIHDSIVRHLKEYSPRFKLTLELKCCLELDAKDKLHYHEQFKGYKMNKRQDCGPEFTKTFRTSPKVSTTFILSVWDIEE